MKDNQGILRSKMTIYGFFKGNNFMVKFYEWYDSSCVSTEGEPWNRQMTCLCEGRTAIRHLEEKPAVPAQTRPGGNLSNNRATTPHAISAMNRACDAADSGHEKSSRHVDWHEIATLAANSGRSGAGTAKQ